MRYSPSQADVEWATSIVQLVPEGGVLALPRLYRFEHSRRRLVLLNTPFLT
jgi:hypothetical protein